jgi:hypothetical protein
MPHTVVRTPTPTPAATQHQTSQASPAAPAAKKAPEPVVKQKLTDLREQVLAAVQQAQAIAAGGSSGAIDLATKTLQSTLGALNPSIDRLLASVGLSFSDFVAKPSTAANTTATTTAPSLPQAALQPVQQILSGVDALLAKLFGRASG